MGDDGEMVVNDDGSTTVLLKYPITSVKTKEEIDEVTVRRLKVKDMKSAESAGGGEIGQAVALIAVLTDLSKTEVEALDMSDFKNLSTIAEGYVTGK